MADHSSINETPSLPPMPSIAMPSTAMPAASGSGRGGAKYLGLGGPLGLSGLSARRTANVRSVTSAAVMVNSTAGSRPKLPLLLSPVNPSLGLAVVGGPLSAGGYAGGSSSQSINLAGIRRDMREGPRRLPSISASMHRRDSSPAEARCMGGGLGIFNAGMGSSNSGARNSSLLPSPMPTPTQAMHQGFDADRAFPPSPPSAASAATGQRPGLRSHADSLSILASAAGRAQVRHASSTHRSTISHHPYLRTTPWRPGSVGGPSMRSVSLKQSEDIRQLGVLDQSLRLK
ncbi:hypothetical protein GGF37_007524 [Kickxella alabastrina]|nr:hypothetical protein GGF37_007524 [Kickxella alabastrina]